LGLFPPLQTLVQLLRIAHRDGEPGRLFDSTEEFLELFSAALDDEEWAILRAQKGWQGQFFLQNVEPA
jgi:hypothetical protein